jgi:hypothetical protein
VIYNKSPLVELRLYLIEKKNMALCRDAQLFSPTFSKYVTFRVDGVLRKMWDRVFEPEIRRIVPVKHIEYIGYIYEGYLVTLDIEADWAEEV